MAPHAEQVARSEGTRGVGVMTIRATNSLVIHFTLYERPVNVDLVVDLAVA